MKTVYRVEDKNGRGPYYQAILRFRKPEHFSIFKKLVSHEKSHEHPNWDQDFTDQQDVEFLNYSRCGYRISGGFENMKDLFKWFGGLIPQFYKHTDLRIKKYMVNDNDIFYSKSGKQIIFKRSA